MALPTLRATKNIHNVKYKYKKNSLSVMLTVMEQKVQKSLQMILLGITLTFRRYDGG